MFTSLLVLNIRKTLTGQALYKFQIHSLTFNSNSKSEDFWLHQYEEIAFARRTDESALYCSMRMKTVSMVKATGLSLVGNVLK